MPKKRGVDMPGTLERSPPALHKSAPPDTACRGEVMLLQACTTALLKKTEIPGSEPNFVQGRFAPERPSS